MTHVVAVDGYSGKIVELITTVALEVELRDDVYATMAMRR